jgi:hypothetical protein
MVIYDPKRTTVAQSGLLKHLKRAEAGFADS